MSGQQSKADRIEEVRSHLPLPEDPPAKSDFDSFDARATAVGSGGVSSDVSTGDGSSAGFRGAATGGSGAREADGVDLSGFGRQGAEGLDGFPKDARAR